MKLQKKELPKESLHKIYDRLPKDIILERPNGKTSLRYISANTSIDFLNEIFGELGWDFEIIEHWIEKGRDFKKIDYRTKEETIEAQGEIAHVKVRIRVTMLDENGNSHTVVKESFGSKEIIGNQSAQSDAFKAAQSDALKKAASLLGIGLELYRDKSEMNWFEEYIAPCKMPATNRERINEIISAYEIDDEDLEAVINNITEGRYSSVEDMTEEYEPILLEKLEKAMYSAE